MLGGRVKTLHPRVHAGILARRDEAGRRRHARGARDRGVRPRLRQPLSVRGGHGPAGVTEEEAVETIDIGGPSMLRGAAKNFAHCAPVCRPEQYGRVLEELRASGELSLETRRAARGGGVRAHRRLRGRDRDVVQRARGVPRLARRLARQGARPRLRREPAPARRVLRRARRPPPPPLARRAAAREGALLQQPQRPLGARARSRASSRCRPASSSSTRTRAASRSATTIEEAYDKALASDPTSAYGGVVVLNREVEAPLGEKLAEQFVEVLFAPGYAERRPRRAAARRRTRASSSTASAAPATPGERSYKRVIGGMLVQDSDAEIEDRDSWQLVDRRARRAAVGRPRLRVARVQARRLERDRPRQGPADDRDRRRPDEPRRRGADRGREGGRVRPRPDRARRSPPTRSSPSPTARRSRSTPARRRSSSRAARAATTR